MGHTQRFPVAEACGERCDGCAEWLTGFGEYDGAGDRGCLRGWHACPILGTPFDI